MTATLTDTHGNVLAQEATVGALINRTEILHDARLRWEYPGGAVYAEIYYDNELWYYVFVTD